MVRNVLKRIRRRAIALLPVSVRFGRIYTARRWAGGGSETRSGAGSTLAATQGVRAQLPKIIEELGAEALLDVGCGDFNWMKEITLPCHYHGVDIVDAVIAENTARYARPGVSFSTLDAIKEPLPPGFDVVLCREVLFHLSFADGERLLRNVASSGAQYLLATTNTELQKNRDIVTGDYRGTNLERAPYSLPSPQGTIDDSAISQDRVLALWSVDDIRSSRIR